MYTLRQTISWKFGAVVCVCITVVASWQFLRSGRSDVPGLPQMQSSAVSPSKPISNAKASRPLDWKKLPLTMDNTTMLARLDLTPAIARELLERARIEVKGVVDRARISSAIMMALCKQGYSAEAWELIESDPGDVRSYEIASFVMNSTQSVEDLTKVLALLPSPEEHTRALHCLLLRPGAIASIDFDKLPPLSSQEKSLVANTISHVINDPLLANRDTDEGRQLLQKSVDLVRGGRLDVENLAVILGDGDPNRALKNWELVQGLADDVTAGELERLYKAVAPSLVGADADKAMDLICSSQATKYSYQILSSAITKMYESDPVHANTWVTSHISEIDPATAQRIISCVAQTAIRNNEFEAANQWANRILNADVRAELLKQAAEYQAAQSGGK